MLDLLTVGPKFTRPACRAAAAKRQDDDGCRLIAGTRRWKLLIDLSCPRPNSAANPPHVAAAVDRRDNRQTDRWTDGGQTDRRTGEH